MISKKNIVEAHLIVEHPDTTFCFKKIDKKAHQGHRSYGPKDSEVLSSNSEIHSVEGHKFFF